MNDTNRTVASETRVYPSRAAANRASNAHRAALITELGWNPEGNTAGEKYVASSMELTRWVNEKRATDGRPALPFVTFTDSFNMEKVKILTVHRFDVHGAQIND